MGKELKSKSILYSVSVTVTNVRHYPLPDPGHWITQHFVTCHEMLSAKMSRSYSTGLFHPNFECTRLAL